MRFTVDPTRSTPIYAQLVEQVKHAVAAGALVPGDPLPSLRDLAVRLRVSPLTIKRAYGELEALGIVVTEHGRGTFVTDYSRTLGEQYRRDALAQAVDRLLVEAHHLAATDDELVTLLHERRRLLEDTADEPA